MTLVSRLVFFAPKITPQKSSARVDTTQVSVVIPVKDNQKGINQYLEYFFKTQSPEHYPKEIVIVDNNSSPAIFIEPRFLNAGLRIQLLLCTKAGPAAARNMGVQHSQGQWILFNDSDCVPSESLLPGYLKADNGSVAYAGNIKALNRDRLSCYYESQEILIPLKTRNANGELEPQYLITANTLVWKEAFMETGGFNEQIKIAGGEDVDLGIRLSQLGKLSYAFDSIAFHDFEKELKYFKKRFRRYGLGNRGISELYGVDLSPKPFLPIKKKPINFILAFIQYLSLRRGYYS